MIAKFFFLLVAALVINKKKPPVITDRQVFRENTLFFPKFENFELRRLIFLSIDLNEHWSLQDIL